ncbi:hypothetical protein [Paenibacillus sp. MBLB4367]|uniref:hypothetical protein n=1 Tax=Paenibacillus sp. MBLB4367 TaxID=3384767 RepID=UPI0039084529
MRAPFFIWRTRLQWKAFSFPIRRAPAGTVKITPVFGNSVKICGKVHVNSRLQVTDAPSRPVLQSVFS